MSSTYSCPVCKSNSEKIPSNKDGENVSCPRCGHFFISGSALQSIKYSQLTERQIANLSGWLKENQNVNISSNNLESLLALLTPAVSERAEKLMRAIEKLSKYIGDTVHVSDDLYDNDWLSISWSQNESELNYLIRKYLIDERGWLNDQLIFGSGITVQITPSGYAFLDQLRQGQGQGIQGFCAMWFDDKMTPIWTEAISPAISAAGYRPIRIDEVNHNNRIDDEILSQIRRSRFVVADFTGDRGGVYFEAGFALGLGIQVIWTIQEENLKEVHFDNRQYNFLQWSMNNLPAFKKALQSRIEAALGSGPLNK